MVAAAGTAVAVSAGPPPAPIAAVGAPNVTRGEPSVAPPSPDATVPEASAPRRRITMAFTGDILIHERLWQTAAAQAGPGERYDFRSLFAPIRPTIADADLAICHLETPLSPAGRQPSSFPIFSTPPEVASAIAWAGYDGCSTASNHSLDGGTAGVVATLDHLDAAGLGHAGTARTRAEASRIARYRVGGVVVAHLSATWSFNGSSPDTAWRAERIDTSALIVDARRARRAGADLVVVSLHAGVEYTHRPTAYQRRVAERLTRGDAIDLIVGHHAHVVQPIHRVHGTWVAFGLGNHLSGMTSSLGTEAVQDGVVLVVTAQRRRGGTWSLAPRVVPTRVDGVRWRVLPVGVTLDRSWASPQLRAELRASWARTLAAVRLLGDEIRPVPRG
jgi:poly-gamma-glutamate synthesis protein (capsule biosynthesis protein)